MCQIFAGIYLKIFCKKLQSSVFELLINFKFELRQKAPTAKINHDLNNIPKDRTKKETATW